MRLRVRLRWGQQTLFLCASLISSPVLAEPAAEESKAACLSSYEQAQRLRNEGDLTGALAGFAHCRSDRCPIVMHADCEQWFVEALALTPTILFEVRGSTRTEQTRVTVKVDGQAPIAFNGRPMPLNPGSHHVEFEAPNQAAATVSFVLNEGDAPRAMAVTLEHAAVPTRAAVPSGAHGASTLSTPFWIATSAAAASAAVFAWFGLRARAADAALDDCAPSCRRSDVDSVRHEYSVTNAAAASLAGSTLLALIFLATAPRAPARRPSPARVEPVLSASSWGVLGRF